MLRDRVPLQASLPPSTARELDEWIASQPIVPPRSRVVEVAVKEFLERRKAPSNQHPEN